jgi:hypothetical protein
MSFFSKLWGGIKNTFKKIGKGIKKAAQSVGKFMNKIGVAGQIALMFILPGIGGMIGKGVAAMAGSANPILAGLGKVLTTAGKFAHTAGNAFKTVTDGVMSFVSDIGRGFINTTAKALGANAPIVGGPQSLSQGFQQWMSGVSDGVSNITSPFKAPAEQVSATVESTWEKVTLESEPILEKPFEMPKVEQPYGSDMSGLGPRTSDFRFYEVPLESIQNIQRAEQGALRSYVSKTAEYAMNTVKGFPERAIDVASENLAQGVATRAAQTVGLAQEPEYNVTNITNPIPEFNSTPINNRYEAAGLNYGATPDNRIQFFAAQNTPFDYGLSGWQQFSQLKPVGA